MKHLYFTIAALAALLTITALFAQVPVNQSSLPRPDESLLFVERYAELQPEERVSVQVYEHCNKSVVNIDTQTTYNMMFLGEIDEPGAGSGIVLDKQGHILTNSHVISGVDAASVTLYNGESYDAKLVGQDPVTDLAVIKIQAPPETLFPITFGDSSKLLVGQSVYAIGNPFGLERTLTSGLISSLKRSIPGRIEARSIKGAIQIDAAINPGNSGGALLDTKGRLIGINTAIASKSGGSHGVGFAIPTNTITRIVPQLLKNGKVIRGDTGIGAVREIERTPEGGGTAIRGLLVRSLVPKGAAEQAGLRGPAVVKERRPFQGMVVMQSRIDPMAADVITAVDGIPVKKVDDFTAIVDEHKPGDKITLEVFREGKKALVPIVLE
jgi:S1-C subfamily serine protease